jgi:hypothetical protein
MQFGCACGQNRGGYDNARYADQLVHGVCSELAELEHIEPRTHGDLNVGDGVGSILGVLLSLRFGSTRANQREQNGTRCFCCGTLELGKSQYQTWRTHGKLAHQGQIVSRTVLNRVSQLVVVEADMSEVDFKNALFQKEIGSQLISTRHGVRQYRRVATATHL